MAQILIKNAKGYDGKKRSVSLEGTVDLTIDGEGLTCLPALIDTHVHFRQPGHEYKEDWGSASQAAIAGGVTTVIDMPNNNPPCVTGEALAEKKRLIETMLAKVDIPLRYHLYFGADPRHFDEIPRFRNEIAGVKVFMGSSTGSLLVDRLEDQEHVFRIAAENDLLVSVHAEDEEMIETNRKAYQGALKPSAHSKIRHPDAALKATRQAIALSEKHGTRLCILHVSTAAEVDAIRAAKARGAPVYAEATPHHLFLDESDYSTLGTKGQVNPPLRTPLDREGLWAGIHDGTIDFIGTDHAPHTLEEKGAPFGQAPSGVPGIELLLPLLLDAHNRGLLSLEQIVRLTRTRAEEVFRLQPNPDVVLVDLNLEKRAHDGELKTKCQWSPYHGRMLRGWPVCTILKGNVHAIEDVSCQKS